MLECCSGSTVNVNWCEFTSHANVLVACYSPLINFTTFLVLGDVVVANFGWCCECLRQCTTGLFMLVWAIYSSSSVCYFSWSISRFLWFCSISLLSNCIFVFADLLRKTVDISKFNFWLQILSVADKCDVVEFSYCFIEKIVKSQILSSHKLCFKSFWQNWTFWPR